MCGNYSREETIQGRKLYEEIRYLNPGGEDYANHITTQPSRFEDFYGPGQPEKQDRQGRQARREGRK